MSCFAALLASRACHFSPRHVMLYCVMVCHLFSCHVSLCYIYDVAGKFNSASQLLSAGHWPSAFAPALSCCLMSCHVMSCQVVSCLGTGPLLSCYLLSLHWVHAFCIAALCLGIDPPFSLSLNVTSCQHFGVVLHVSGFLAFSYAMLCLVICFCVICILCVVTVKGIFLLCYVLSYL